MPRTIRDWPARLPGWAGLALFLCSVPALAQEAAARPPLCAPGQVCIQGVPASAVLVLAQKLIDAGRYDEASAALAGLRDLPPDLATERSFLSGLILIGEKDYDGAARRFRAILADQPQLQRVRLELARALFLARQDRAAEYHFRLVLADKPPQEVAANIERFLALIRDRRVVSFQVQFGIVPDSNANAAPDEDEVELFGLPFTLSKDARQRGGLGLSVSGQMVVRPRISENMRFTTILSAQRTEFLDSPFDDMVISGQSGPEIATSAGIFSPSVVYFRRWFANDPYNDGLGARLSWEKDLSDHWSAQAYAEWRHIDNFVNDGLDGPFFAGGLYLQERLDGRSYLDYQLALSRHATKDRTFAYVAPDATVGYGREFPAGITAYASIEGAPSFYDAEFPAFGRTRQDLLLKGTIAIIKRDWNFAGFAPVLRYSYSRNSSNIDFYEYTRMRAEVTFTRTF